MLLTSLLILHLATEGDVIRDALDKVPQSPPWTWVREHRDAWRVHDGRLQIRAQRGTLWTAVRNDAKNLLLRPWPAAEAGADSFISVTVHFAPEQGGEQAGVMFYFGDDYYVKLVRESLEGRRWIVLGREEGGKPQQIAKQPVESDEVTLYLARHGDRIEALYALPDDAERRAIGNCLLPPAPQPQAELKFGLFAHGGPPAPEARWATFSDLAVTSLPPKK